MFLHCLRQLEEILCAALVATICLVVSLQMFCRVVLRSPLSWTEEMATLLFIWIVMIGSALALKRSEHFAVELLQQKLRQSKDRRLAQRLVNVCLTIFCLLLIWQGGVLAARSWSVVTPAMEIPRSFAYAAVPCGGMLMLWRTIEHWCRQENATVEREREPVEQQA